MGVDDLERRLIEAIERHLELRGVRLGDGAESYFRDHARRAAEEIWAQPEPMREQKLREAERNFERLIETMTSHAQRIPGYRERRGNVIGEETLGASLSDLCPLWPFC